jgi:outer membrane biosynthesis protein TonB
MSSTTNRYVRAGLMISALALGLMLAGCETFDPTDLTNIFDTKKRLPGERKPVFPEGTPGVPQGVPPDLVKGYQQPEQAAPAQEAVAEPEKPKPKPKPKPKVVAKPAESAPTPVTVRPSAPPSSNSQGGGTQWPDPPQAQQQPQQQQQQQQSTGGGWSGSQGGAVGSRWPDPPPVR